MCLINLRSMSGPYLMAKSRQIKFVHGSEQVRARNWSKQFSKRGSADCSVTVDYILRSVPHNFSNEYYNLKKPFLFSKSYLQADQLSSDYHSQCLIPQELYISSKQKPHLEHEYTMIMDNNVSTIRHSASVFGVSQWRTVNCTPTTMSEEQKISELF